MIEFLKSFCLIVKTIVFDYVPNLLFTSLGIFEELLDTIDAIKIIWITTPIIVGTAIMIYKKYIR